MNQFDIQKGIRNALTADTMLTAWLASNYAGALTIKLGNRVLKTVKPEQYPLVVVVFDPVSTGEKVRNTPHWLVENYHLEVGLFQQDVETALQHLAELESLVTQAALNYLRGILTGADEHAEIVDRIGDADVNHPHHFFGIKIQVRRHAAY